MERSSHAQAGETTGSSRKRTSGAGAFFATSRSGARSSPQYLQAVEVTVTCSAQAGQGRAMTRPQPPQEVLPGAALTPQWGQWKIMFAFAPNA